MEGAWRRPELELERPNSTSGGVESRHRGGKENVRSHRHRTADDGPTDGQRGALAPNPLRTRDCPRI